jgi:hypothetical protein
MKTPLTQTIVNHLKENKGWAFKGDIEKLAQRKGYYAYTGARAAQRLAKEGKIVNKYTDRGLVMYRAKRKGEK